MSPVDENDPLSLYPADETAPEARVIDATRAPMPAGRTRGALWLEAGVVALVVALPFYHAAIESLVLDPPALGRVRDAFGRIAEDVPLIALVLYLIHRGGEPWGRFGLRRPHPIADPALTGVALLVDASLWIGMSRVIGAFFGFSDPDEGPPLPPGVAANALVVTAVAIAAFMEELVFRGHLIPRIEQATGSSVAAVLISTAIFTGYHCYQGPQGVALIFAFGIAYSVFFCATRRIWPIAIGHTLLNLGLIYNS